MRRELFIAAGVLVPFALLVAAGFWFSAREVESTPGSISLESPLPAKRGEGQGEGPAPEPSPEPSPERAPPLPRFPPELAAPLKAVLPEVEQCFVDQKLKAPHQVRVRFTPTRDGGFEGVQVDEQQPYLAACLEDVFAEVTWRPEGPETYLPATHTFSFGAPPD